jgi:hypothetical protein
MTFTAPASTALLIRSGGTIAAIRGAANTRLDGELESSGYGSRMTGNFREATK